MPEAGMHHPSEIDHKQIVTHFHNGNAPNRITQTQINRQESIATLAARYSSPLTHIHPLYYCAIKRNY